jgi:hypothetical protein
VIAPKPHAGSLLARVQLHTGNALDGARDRIQDTAQTIGHMREPTTGNPISSRERRLVRWLTKPKCSRFDPVTNR